MATIDLEYKTKVKLDLENLKSELGQASNLIDSKLSSASSNAGAKGGKQFSQSFTSQLSGLNSAITSIFAGISFDTLIQGSLSAFSSFSTLQRGQLALNSSISAYNSINKDRVAILNDSTQGTLKQAEALGINTDKLYKTVAGSKLASDATKGLRQQVNQLERSINTQERSARSQINTLESGIRVLQQEKNANDDTIDSIRNKIQLLKDETEERIKQFKIVSGFNDLTQANRQIALDIKKLEVQKKQNIENTNINLVYENQNRVLDKQINSLEKKRLQNEIAIDPLQREIDSLEEINSLQIKNEQDRLESIQRTNRGIEENINNLRTQIENLNLKLEIDTEPARLKIEQLRDQIEDINLSQSGSSPAIDDKKIIDPKAEEQLKKRIEFIKKNLIKEINPAEVQAKIQELVKKTSGLASEGSLTQAFATLTSSGAGQGQALTLLENYIVATSKSTVGSKNLGQGVENLAESFQTGVSALGNLNGLQENYDTVVIPKGIQALKKLYQEQGILQEGQELSYDTLSLQEQAFVKAQGTQTILANRLGDSEQAWSDFNKTVDSGALELAKVNAEIERTKAEIGEALSPVILEFLKVLTPIIDQIGNFAKANPELTRTIVILVGAVAGLVFVFGGLTTIISGLATIASSPFLLPVIVALGIVVATVIGLINTVILLKAIWDSNFLAVRDVTNTVLKFIEKGFTEVFNFVKPFVDVIDYLGKVAFFVMQKAGEQAFKALGLATQFVFNMFKQFILQPFADLYKTIKPYLDQVSNLFKSIFEGIGGIASGVFKGILNTVIDFINKGIKIVNNLVKNIPDIPGITKPQPMKEIPKFAKGGFFDKPTFGLFGEAGEEAILNKMGIKNLGLTPELVKILNSRHIGSGGDNISGSYNNTNIQIFGNTEPDSFRPALGF
jgi:hypothetical protein